MKTKLFLIISVALIIVSCLIGYFTDVGSDIPALIGTAFGIGMEIIVIWKKSKKQNALLVVTIVLAVIGGLCCSFAGLTEASVTTLAAAVIGFVSLIASVITGIVLVKQNK